MKATKFLVAFALTAALGYALNTAMGVVPALGKFLDPVSGFWANAGDGNSERNATLDLPGLEAPVQVVYDDHAVPHIFAQNDADLYFAQGYITAQDRLWQLEFQTHAAAGRLTELVGKSALDMDRTARRIGMKWAAENAISRMDKSEIMGTAVNSYAAGINAYISSLSPEEYPLEFKLLGYAPEPWTATKSGLLLKYMARDLSFGERDLENTNAKELFGEEMFDILYPDVDTYDDPIVNRTGDWDFEAIQTEIKDVAHMEHLITSELVDQPNIWNGSNNWAVSPEKTRNGNAILSSDPHLGLNLPSIWYTMQLNAPGVSVMGATLPGSPNVIIGFNESVAWGVTNAQRDVVDWYEIQFKDETKQQYKLDGQWVDTEIRIEEHIIKGGDTFIDTVYYTHFGPVVFDDSFRPDDEKKYYALRWIAHEPSDEVMTFYELNRAKNHEDYMKALDHYSAPAQNFAFASVDGDIAMRVQGKYPLKGQEEGKYLLDGTVSENDWEFIPMRQNVMDLNPERGFISSANQHPADSTYPYYVHARSFEAYRNRRINQRLGEMENITVDDLMDLQSDNYNLKAAESVPTFLAALHGMELSESQQEAVKHLSGWDFFNNPGSKPAAYFEAWWDKLYPLIWDEMKREDIDLARPTSYNTIKLLKLSPEFKFFDHAETPEIETAKEIIIKGFKEGVAHVEEWKEGKGDDWGWHTYKNTTILHLARIDALSRTGIPNGGNHQIVNATSERHGPSWRMVVELDPAGVRAYGVYPGGQSGNPGSPYYDDMLGLWTEGAYFDLILMKNPTDHPGQILATQNLK